MRSEFALSGAVLFFFFSDSVRNLAKLKFLLFCQMKDILEFRVTVPLIGNRKKKLDYMEFPPRAQVRSCVLEGASQVEG